MAVNLIMTPSGQLSNIDEILCTLISRLFSKSVNAKLSAGFFCQIIMGSPLNSNVSEGLSVLQCLDKILYSCVFTKNRIDLFTCRKRKFERIQQKLVPLCFRGIFLSVLIKFRKRKLERILQKIVLLCFGGKNYCN